MKPKLFGLTLPMIAAVATLQTLALAYMLYDRLALLRFGQEIVAEVIPVDPRDLFRGDYVILGYSFTQGAQSDVAVGEGTRVGDSLYVVLNETAPGKWQALRAETQYPSAPGAGNVVVRGRVTYITPKTETTPARANLRYGIESYFVPEGKGLELEKQVREKKISAVLAVGSSGDVAIKALMVDGKRIAEEPLL